MRKYEYLGKCVINSSRALDQGFKFFILNTFALSEFFTESMLFSNLKHTHTNADFRKQLVPPAWVPILDDLRVIWSSFCIWGSCP